jgi:ribosomal protein L40E
MNKKNYSDCEFLVDNRFCEAVTKGEGKGIRGKSCTNDLKNSCCYLCGKRDLCEISCRYLDKVAEPTVEKAELVVPDSQKCDNCGTANKIGAKFCKKCGASMQKTDVCPKCGNKLESDAAFCQECGYRVKSQVSTSFSGTVTRRLPFGLEILIALGALGALFYFGSAIMAFWAATWFPRSSEISQTIVTTGIVWMILALFQVSVSWGLWRLREWARKTLVIMAILDIVGAFINPIYGITGLVFRIVVLWYVYTPHVKSLFGS